MAKRNTWWRFLRKHRGFYILLLLAILLRVDFILESGLSNDELSAWYRTRFNSWDDFWFYGVSWGDMHPAFYQALLWVWVRLFGDSDLSIRLLPFLFYLASFSLLYRIGTKHFSRLSGLLAIGIFAASSYFVLHTGFSRPYASGMFFVLLFLCGLFPLLEHRKINKRRTLMWLIVGMVGAMLSHYFAFLVVGLVGLSALFWVQQKHRKFYLIAGAVSVLLFACHFSVTWYHLNRGGLNWLGLPSNTWLFDTWVLVINQQETVAFVFGGVMVLAGLVYSKWTPQRLFLISSFVLVLIAGFVVSHVFTPVLRESVFVFMYPLVIFGLLGGLKKMPFQGLSKLVVVAGAGVLCAWTVIEFPPGKPIHFPVFKEIGQSRNQLANQFPDDQRTDVFNTNNSAYLLRYSSHPIHADIGEFPDAQKDDELRRIVRQSNTPYFYYAYSNNFHLPDFLDEILRRYPFLIDHVKYPGAGGYLFGKSPFEGKRVTKELLTIEPDRTKSSDEYFLNWKIKVSELKKLMGEECYFYISTSKLHHDKHPVRMVVVLESEQEARTSADDSLSYYRATDIQVEEESHVVFEILDDMDDSDYFKFYVWNPEKIPVELESVKLNQVILNPTE